VAALENTPRIGKPVEELPDYQDLVIPFGAAGYLCVTKFIRERSASSPSVMARKPDMAVRGADSFQ